MRIGLIGLSNSGKTTIFNALTKSSEETSSYSGQDVKPNIGVVDVIDKRLDFVYDYYRNLQSSHLSQKRIDNQNMKKIYATVEYIDFCGIKSDKESDEIFDAETLSLFRTTDEIALVIRNFSDSIINEAYGVPKPLKDIEILEQEFIFSDFVICSNRIERIMKDIKRGNSQASLKKELDILQKCQKRLEQGNSLSNLKFREDELKILSGFQFLSLKPILVILNSDENNFQENLLIIKEIEKYYDCIEIAGKFEMELSQLEENEAKLFMHDMGIKSSAIDRLTKKSYELLGLITFFTTEGNEIHAWTITKGTNAKSAAGKIHSDMEKGFIKAECFSVKDLKKYGSEKELRNAGKFFLKGKDYIVKDGDILKFRFNV